MNLKRWAYKLHRTWVAKACRCGDEAHHNLEKWYEKYSGNEPIDPWEMAMFERLNSRDKFDRAVLEEQIQKVSLQNPVINGYCPSCQRLLDEWPEIIQKVPVSDSPYPGDPYRHPHYSCTPEFEAGYRNGCQLCTKFVQFWKIDGYLFEDWHKKENRLNSLGKSTIISLFVRKAFGAITLILTWPGTSYDSCKYHSLSFCDSSDGQRFDPGEDAPLLTAHGDLSQIELAKKWFEVCSEKHEACKPIENHQLPTRLIDLGSTPIRLVQSSNLTTKPRYAALSHCWGTLSFYQLEQDNLEESMSAIPEEKLTKTFRDAISISRSLGLQYLWIDSLCIIQRCNIDWQQESALMSSVYGGSAITIAAAGAVDGTEGCFLKPAGFTGNIRFGSTGRRIWAVDPPINYQSISKSPLAGRAWAVQERILSTRMLHFTKQGLFWECHYDSASEYSPEGLTAYERFRSVPWKKADIYKNWDSIVRLYTNGNLTCISDKMVALSGVARKAFEESGDQYLAGLWKNDIERQILWIVPPRELRKVPTKSSFPAPSWSWASAKLPTLYHNKSEVYGHVLCAHFLSTNVVSVGKNPFGEFAGGELRMTCSFMLGGKLEMKSYGVVGEEMEDVFNVEWHLSDGREESFNAFPDSYEHVGQDVHLLPVLRSPEDDHQYGMMIEGLLLLSTGTKKGVYSRVGIFSLHISGEFTDIRADRFWELLEESGQAVAEAGCAEILEEPKFGNERYVITII